MSLLRRHLPVLLFAVLSLLITAPRLFGGEWVLGSRDADMSLQFISWRDFGFSEIRAGHFPLWNPYIFGGAPYFAGFQSALLYPPNWIHLLLPTATAINWVVAIHLFLAGWLMYRWCRAGGRSEIGSVLAGACWMFSGPFYLRIFAGHLANLCVIPWVPLLWEAIDDAFRRPRLGAILKGSFALSMMVLAGHPQYVYFTGLVTAFYVLLKLFDASDLLTKAKALGICAAIVAGGSAISCVQWLTAIDANSETVRSVGLEYPMAASFSFPPENIWTLAAPSIFGSLSTAENATTPPGYFGRGYLWEMSLFMSVAGSILAIIGMSVETIDRRGWKWIVLLVIVGVLAIGAHTPLHRFLFDHLPMFASFRGASKFSFLFVMILCKLAADGWDAIEQNIRPKLVLSLAASVAAALLIFSAIAFAATPSGKQSFFARHIRDHLEAASEAQECYLDMRLLATNDFFNQASRNTAISSFIAGCLAIGVTGAIVARRWKRESIYAISAIAGIELLTFAFHNRAVTTANTDVPADWKDVVAKLPRDARILTPEWANNNWSMSWRVPNVWGYDPNVQLRYAQLLYASQGLPPDKAGQYISFRRMSASMRRLLRIGAILLNHSKPAAISIPDPLPTASLVSIPFVVKERDELLKLVVSDQFDPQFSVALESPPAFELSRSFDLGDVKILSSTTDSLEIDANVKASSMLVSTNAYSKHWHVTSLLSPQANFDVVPANGAFMGIALKPGRHHLRLDYSPSSFAAGAWISAISTSAFLAGLGAQIFSRRRRHSSDN